MASEIIPIYNWVTRVLVTAQVFLHFNEFGYQSFLASETAGRKLLSLLLKGSHHGSLDKEHVLEASKSVEEIVLTLPENLSQVLIVHGP